MVNFGLNFNYGYPYHLSTLALPSMLFFLFTFQIIFQLPKSNTFLVPSLSNDILKKEVIRCDEEDERRNPNPII
jgi:hypothetical protein